MEKEDFKKVAEVTYVHVFGFVRNNSSHPFIGFIEVPYSYDTFMMFDEDQRQAICQAVILRQSGYLVQGFRHCDPDKFFMTKLKQ